MKLNDLLDRDIVLYDVLESPFSVSDTKYIPMSWKEATITLKKSLINDHLYLVKFLSIFSESPYYIMDTDVIILLDNT